MKLFFVFSTIFCLFLWQNADAAPGDPFPGGVKKVATGTKTSHSGKSRAELKKATTPDVNSVSSQSMSGSEDPEKQPGGKRWWRRVGEKLRPDLEKDLGKDKVPTEEESKKFFKKNPEEIEKELMEKMEQSFSGDKEGQTIWKNIKEKFLEMKSEGMNWVNQKKKYRPEWYKAAVGNFQHNVEEFRKWRKSPKMQRRKRDGLRFLIIIAIHLISWGVIGGVGFAALGTGPVAPIPLFGFVICIFLYAVAVICLCSSSN